MIKLTQNSNGLLIALDSPSAASEIEHTQHEKQLNEEHILAELLESAGYIGNGWAVIAPEDIGALTSAPIVGYMPNYNDDGKVTDAEAIYWFPRYMVESFIDTLLEKSEVLFEKAEDWV